MGYMQHHAIVVTSWKEDVVESLHSEAVRLGMSVTPVVESAINGYWSFLVGPDGSKLGWDADAIGNRQREAFVATIRSHVYEDGSSSVDWVEVQYGDDNYDTHVVHSGDHDQAGRRAGRHVASAS